MKCNHCGAEILDDSVFCEHCGKKIGEEKACTEHNGYNSILVWVGGFCSLLIPIVGLILHGINRKKNPSRANVFLWCTIIGIILGILCGVLLSTQQNNHAYYEYDYNVEPAVIESESLICSQPEEIYCDGIYERGHGLHISLPNSNKNHFRIEFSFKPLSYKGILSWTDLQLPLIFGYTYRHFSICLKSDKRVYISVGEDLYSTDIKYTTNQYNYISLEYDASIGIVTINGQGYSNIPVSDEKIDTYIGSLCFSTGNAFKGYVKDIFVYNIN